MTAIYDALMYLTGWPLALVLILGGLYFTFRTKFVQFRLFIESFKVVTEKANTPDGVSPFGALMISTASRVGTGNIIGVSTAICLGGAGAIFWMYITAIIGSAAAFVESTLAQIYKRRNPDNSSYGGPSFYIESACKSKFLAIVFALALIFTYGVGYNMLASYNLQSSFEIFSFYKKEYCWYFGIATAALFLFTILGGSKRLVKTTGTLVPFMGGVYILFSIIALVMNYQHIPEMLKIIFADAFNFKAIFGGFSGSVIMWGLKRGLYSNEAGIGSAPNAAAAASTTHPVKQGLVQMLSVFIDTNIICTATALMCLVSGVTPDKALAGAPFVQKAMATTFGVAGPIMIAVAMTLFAFTTLLGNFYYVENNFAYIFGKKPGKKTLLTIRIAGAILILVGSSLAMDIAWGIADISQCLLALINIPVCIIIGKVAYKALDNYTSQRKAKVTPKYIASQNGVKEPCDFWNE